MLGMWYLLFMFFRDAFILVFGSRFGRTRKSIGMCWYVCFLFVLFWERVVVVGVIGFKVFLRVRVFKKMFFMFEEIRGMSRFIW